MNERAEEESVDTATRIKNLLGVSIIDDWTKGFCESLLDQTLKGRKLSPRQLEILQAKEEAYDADAIAEANSWISSWNPEKAEIFCVCAMYYKNTGYFRVLAGKVDHNGNIEDGYVPPRGAYNKMCSNKYAMKVRKAWFDAPKYPMGSVVALRPSAPRFAAGQSRPSHRDGKTISHFVIEVNADYPTSACAGAKVYKVIAAGSADPFTVEERHIKKGKKIKKR
jgi:hypothetical protein